MEEEDDDVEDVIPSLPPILPRLINFELGTSVQKRSFSYDLPTMQGDSSFRIGYQIGLEAYPMMTQPNGWYRTLGIGGSYAKEYGDAITQGMSGMFTGYPVNQGRWGFDARYAIPVGEHVVLIPALGLRQHVGRPQADVAARAVELPHGRDGAVLRGHQDVVCLGGLPHPRRGDGDAGGVAVGWLPARARGRERHGSDLRAGAGGHERVPRRGGRPS